MADQTVEDLGQAAKKAHPGQFDKYPNVTLGRAVKAAHPDDFSEITDPFPHMQSLGPPGASVPTPGRGLPGDPPAFPEDGIMGMLHTPIHGVQQIMSGVHRMHSDDEGETRGGVADVVQGIMKVLSPYAAQQLVTNPTAVARVVGGGAVGGGVADVASQMSGASPGQTELNETLGQLGGGASAQPVSEAISNITSKASDAIMEKYLRNTATPGGKKLITGGVQTVGGLTASALGHSIAGPLFVMRGAQNILEGLGQKAELGRGGVGSTELPKGTPSPFNATPQQAAPIQPGQPLNVTPNAGNLFGGSTVVPGARPTPFTRQNTVTSPGAEPQQVTSENVAGGGAPAATPPSTPETPQPPSAEAQQASAMGIHDYDNAHLDVKKVVQSALANKARLEAIRQRQATTPAASIPNTIRSMQPPPEVAPEATSGKDNQGSQAFTSNNPPGGHEVLGLEPTPTQNPSSAVAGVAYHPESGEAALHMQNGKKLVYPGKTQADVNEMITHPSPGTLYNQKWRNAAKTDTSIMRPNTPGEAMRFNNLDPVKSIADNMLDANDLRGAVDAKISANGWNTTDHVTQIRQSVTEAADKMNQARSASGKPPISTSAINSVIRGYQP